jgi:NADH-quinone oxidoreductase subunit M
MVLGVFAFSNIALSGSVLQMLNHGLSTGLLFIAVGMLYERTHTREISDLGGVAKVTPWLAGMFLFAALSSLGLPGLNNFVGEFLVIAGTIGTRMVFGILASVGIVLSAIYLLWSYQRAYQGGTPDRWLHLPDINLREVLLATPIIIAIVAIGVFPKPFLDRINPSTARVVVQVQRGAVAATPTPAAPPGSAVAQGSRVAP